MIRRPLVRAAAGVAIALFCTRATTNAGDANERAGGDATVFDEGPRAYGRALGNLDPARWGELRAGKARFVGDWPRRGPSLDATSCSSCHFHDGRGPGPDPAHRGLVLLLRLGQASGGLDPTYGPQLRRIGNTMPAPGLFEVRWEEIAGDYPSGERFTLRRPSVRVTQLSHGPLDPSTRLSLRSPPGVFGVGLLEAIPDDVLLSGADPHDANRDGISGRAQRTPDSVTGATRVGRFGWKAAQPSLLAQSLAALQVDLGVNGHASDVDPLVFYLRALGVPARRRVTDRAVVRGERLFTRLGCSDCHRPRLTTGAMDGWPELSGQSIGAFTDLLLHDMGPGLADGVVELGALGSEWRTPPLWGLGLLRTVSGEVRLLHDGRARSPEEAILWHGGEAEAAGQRFRALPRTDRNALTAFLDSL
jgi:CxxC motif-containing protein (DUF1111 family)